MMDFSVASQQHVRINTTTPSSCNIVCQKCESLPIFSHFDDFLDHSHAEHGPTVRRSALSIIPDDKLVSAHGSMCHLSTNDSVSTNFIGSSNSNNNNDYEFDLRTLKYQALLDLINLLNKCFCIWHRQTRQSMSRTERFYAYKLMLMKLREHIPFATLRDARSIVRQIIRMYLRRQCLAEGECDCGGDGDVVSRKSKDEGFARQLDVMNSKEVLDRLAFLRGRDAEDVEEFVVDKHCDFCKIGFSNTDTLWAHLVGTHLSAAKQSGMSSSIRSGHYAMDSLSLSRKRTCSRISRSTLYSYTDDGTTQSRTSLESASCLRHSRRRNGEIWQNNRPGRGRNKVVSLNRIRRRHRRSTSGSGTDGVSVSSKPSSNIYLAEYSDKFLEDFIALYRQQECLWQRHSPNYRSRKLKEAAYDVLVKKYCQWRQVPTVSIAKIKKLIRRICTYYMRLKQPNANRCRSQIWQRLAFIDGNVHWRPATPMPKRARFRSRSQSCETNGSTATTAYYNCSMCPRKFRRAKSCATHMLKLHPPTECTRCHQIFNNADEFVCHLLGMHHNEVVCPLCADGTENADWKSSDHLSTHFCVQCCSDCAEIFHDHTNYRRHRSRCRRGNRFHCKHCSLEFTSTMDFRRHAKCTHDEERPFKCDDCEVTFKCLAPLAKHRLLHKQLSDQP